MRISDWSSDVCSSDLVGFAIEDDQLALAEPAAADRGVLRHLDRDRDVGFALVELADQIVVVDGLQIEIEDRKSTRSELQSLMRISYAVFCLKKKKIK